MSTPTELRETAKRYRETAQVIYAKSMREEYAEALNMIWEATRRETYALVIEGKHPELERCIEMNRESDREIRERSKRATVSTEELVRDVRGRYKLFSTPYAERKEESERARHRKRQKEVEESEKTEPRPGFKQLPLFNFGQK